MTAAFWWYLLAGLILGFCLSTVWEWLYFRQRRMRITDRRIAELEQALRSRERDIAVVEVLPEPAVTWSATEYNRGGAAHQRGALPPTFCIDAGPHVCLALRRWAVYAE